MNTEYLVFMKQLLENVEYANESGVLNVIRLLKHEDSDVAEGTSFALGAVDTLQKLIELRPDLFTTRVFRSLRRSLRTVMSGSVLLLKLLLRDCRFDVFSDPGVKKLRTVIRERNDNP